MSQPMFDICALLSQAAPTPDSLHTKDGADALTLALHCLMVNDGFVALDNNHQPRKGFSPPPEWRQVEHQWLIMYSRPGAARPFRLHCSLQQATGRLFVHAAEVAADGEPAQGNIQVLGLQLQNYSNAGLCTEGSWEGVIQNERTLVEMFTEFVLMPLWAHAEKGEAEAVPAASVAEGGALGEPLAALMNVEALKSVASSPTVVGTVAVALAVTTVAVYWMMRPRAAQTASS